MKALKKEKLILKRKEFRILAESVFLRDNYTCQHCGTQYQEDGHALHPHHIIFKAQGGKDKESNLVSLCWRCHRLLHDGFISKDLKKW